MPFLSPNNSVKALKGYQHTVLNPARRDQPPASSFPDPPTEGRHTHTHTPFNGPFSGTTRVSRYQKGKTNLDFTEARDSEWQWHQLGHMQICISLQTENHASTPPLSFLQAGCPSCRPTNSVKALKARTEGRHIKHIHKKHLVKDEKRSVTYQL